MLGLGRSEKLREAHFGDGLNNSSHAAVFAHGVKAQFGMWQQLARVSDGHKFCPKF